ncbi:unnamed protein product [Caenorhabditis sp. 36 PRJEB53466]|nr:unnamed protein product [Caenorhabditis sp. 36 PRJEB53466]
MLFNFVVLIRAHQFHFNFSCIQAVLFVLHFFDNVAVLVLKILMITEIVDNSDPTSSFLFWISMNITICFTFSAMCTLFFLTVERCCATLLMRDYEREKRRYISVLLNLLLLSYGLISCFVIRNKEHTIFVISFLLVINGIALVMHCFLRFWNKHIYTELHDSVSVTAYSLAKRFQVAENIKSLHMMNNIIFYMGLMNAIVVLSVLFSSFNLTPELELFLTFCLDTSIFVYSFCYPVIMYHSCERWKSEMKSSLEWIGFLHRSNTAKVVPILSTFGARLEPANTMGSHFDHLRNSWEAIPRKSIISVER